MLSLLKPSSRRHRDAADESSQSALRHHQQGLEALDSGDLEAALYHFRMGLGHAPLNRALREGLAETLSQAADLEFDEPKKNKRPSAVAPRMGWEESDDEWDAEVLPKKSAQAPTLKRVAEVVKEKVAALPKEAPAPKRSPKKAPKRPVAAKRQPLPQPRYLLGALAFLIVIAGGVAGAHALMTKLMPDGALPSIEKSSQPPAIATALREANAALLAGEAELAVEKLRAVLADHPEEKDLITPSLVMALRASGGKAIARGEYREAASRYTDASVLAPEEADNWLDLGHAHRQAAQSADSSSDKLSALKRAETAYKKALEVARDSFFQASAHASLAQVQMLRGDKNDARDSYQRAKEIDATAPQVRAAEIMMRAMN